jgi:hypothetical protein
MAERSETEPRSWFFRWLFNGARLDDVAAELRSETHPWYLVIWLTGVDYFSTLGYQPGIALLAAGAISPIATLFLVLVTLLCALPTYAQVARRSFAGQGSIAMLENLLPGWSGKILILVLLGFATTDFVITITLSAADAAAHAIANPFLHRFIAHEHMAITLGLLLLLAAVFLKGFSEAIELATAVCVPYLLLNGVVLFRCLIEIFNHPHLIRNWREALEAKGDWTGVVIASAIVFPKLALGLSGFETGVSVMPLIRGGEDDESKPAPEGRIRNARKLLLAAAVIMSVLLMVSSYVTALLIPPHAYRDGGPASGRALAYLAHGLLGEGFGSLYDVSTILILWFAGASAMAGLLHLIPRYLPRLGMAPQWVASARPLILMILASCVLVTFAFRANVEAQGGAYATGVLVLMLSAAVASALSLKYEKRYLFSAYCWVVVLVFLYTTIANIIERPDGIIIASVFISLMLLISAVSRYIRATEFRVSKYTFDNPESEAIWHEIIGKKVNLVPVGPATEQGRRAKAAEILRYYQCPGPLAFIHVILLDNRSEFYAPLCIRAVREGSDYLIEVSQAIAIANTIAYISTLIDPMRIMLGLTRHNMMRQALQYVLLGEGETGIMVYEILVRFWESTPEEDTRPLIFLMSN